ncbi:NAD(P)-binding domain-containing protein [soil metagenome]
MNSNPSLATLPVAVIGAGTVGLAAAAHLHERGFDFVLFESGPAVGAAMREWAHVQLFSPWEYNVDPAAERLLRAAGWVAPEADTYPTGGEIVARYLEPLSALPAIASRLKVNARVTGISRQGRDKMKSDAERQNAPFRIRFETPEGEEEILARAVIDTAGTWRMPNPLGSEGMPARGERSLQPAIRYGIPDVLGQERARYAGRRVLVAGSGHSACNALVDLVQLSTDEPATEITWVVRRDRIGKIFGGGARDKLAARGALGSAVRRLVEAGRLQVVLSFQAEAVERRADGIYVRSGEKVAGPVDEIIVATGFRPDFSYLRELQVGLDPIVESTPALASMIDPNLHSCGTVRPHGHAELAHPESGFYIAGMKSYGRAPTFLMRTGYEQVRSIVAALAGDMAAADRVELVLPETGVCSLRREPEEEAGCCGGAPKSDASACCRKDEEAKTAGEEGCGCSSAVEEKEPALACASAREEEGNGCRGGWHGELPWARSWRGAFSITPSLPWQDRCRAAPAGRGRSSTAACHLGC